MLQQGIQLLDRFCQDDRIRIRQPRRELQIKVTRPASGNNDFVAYVDAIGKLDRERCLIRVENHIEPLLGGTGRATGTGPATRLLFLDDGDLSSRPGRLRPQAIG
jgi:hypothetical protein